MLLVFGLDPRQLIHFVACALNLSGCSPDCRQIFVKLRQDIIEVLLGHHVRECGIIGKSLP